MNKEIKLKIVIVDDNPDDHFFIKQALKVFKNITFVSFLSGEPFIDYLSAKSVEKTKSSELPDIVILDINMPKLTGFDTYKEID